MSFCSGRAVRTVISTTGLYYVEVGTNTASFWCTPTGATSSSKLKINLSDRATWKDTRNKHNRRR